MINLWQLLEVVVWGLLAVAAFNFRNKYVWTICTIIAVVLFMFNPIKVQTTDINSIDNVSRFDIIPEKVEVKRESFEESQKRELENLKKESEEIRDEI